MHANTTQKHELLVFLPSFYFVCLLWKLSNIRWYHNWTSLPSDWWHEQREIVIWKDIYKIENIFPFFAGLLKRLLWVLIENSTWMDWNWCPLQDLYWPPAFLCGWTEQTGRRHLVRKEDMGLEVSVQWEPLWLGVLVETISLHDDWRGPLSAGETPSPGIYGDQMGEGEQLFTELYQWHWSLVAVDSEYPDQRSHGASPCPEIAWPSPLPPSARCSNNLERSDQCTERDCRGTILSRL